MPTYDYRCDACGHAWELFQSITAEPEKKCPECGKKKAKRIIGPGAGFIFKGSGFYLTDYRSESYKEGAKADAKADTKPSDGGSDKSASKTESSTPAKSEPAKTETSKSESSAPKSTSKGSKKDG